MTLRDVQPTSTREPGRDSDGSYDVLVVGAGQTGLTVGYYLQQAGLRFLIVDAADHVGSAWAQRWESLVLFTPRRYNAMPGLPFDGEPGPVATTTWSASTLRPSTVSTNAVPPFVRERTRLPNLTGSSKLVA